MSSPDTQDLSYSPGTFDTWDMKAPFRDDELRETRTRGRGPRLAEHASELPKVAFPKYPTVFELAQTAAEPPVKKNPPGIFELYMSKDPGHILQDATTENRYDDRALSLLGDLQQGSRKWEQLTPTEKGLLDEAALEFFHPPKKIQTHPSSLAPSPASLAPSPATVRTQDGELPKVTPVEGPVMDAFWWTR